MIDAAPPVILAPVTRAQARLFAGIARLLDRRGRSCRIAVPARAVGDEIADAWGPLLVTAPASATAAAPAVDPPPAIGAYDAWRGGWSESQRRRAAAAAIEFWQQLIAKTAARAVVVWNGRDDTFVEAALHCAETAGVKRICLELGPLRQSPMTMAVSRNGVNAAAEFRRPELLTQALVPWEAQKLRAARTRFIAGAALEQVPCRQNDAATAAAGAAAPGADCHAVGPAVGRPFAFLPLQVDDDTQLFHYGPHYADQVEMVRAVVGAMPDGLPLMLKLHPLADARFGRERYAPLLRPGDRIASPQASTLELVARASFVITTNSSAGIEAAMLERPVVVLGDAHYRGRGFTYDLRATGNLGGILAAAAHGPSDALAAQRRDRYLYELLFHELVQLEAHPLRGALSDEALERIAVRVSDLLEPLRLGSDWLPVFDELHHLQGLLRSAIEQLLRKQGDPPLVVASRFALSCLGESFAARLVPLEDALTRPVDDLRHAAVALLAPELAPGQRAAAIERLRGRGAAKAIDLSAQLGEIPCAFHTTRFNRLPCDLRDALYRDSAYWDYYLTHSGLASEDSPQKRTQAAQIADQLAGMNVDSVLEYGCGDGRILVPVAQATAAAGTRIVGVDSSERMLDLARDRIGTGGDVTLVPSDAREILPFGAGEFAAVLTSGALQHVPAADLATVLDELHRVTSRKLLHWEAFEAHDPARGEHYTNPQTSLTIHRETLRRFGPVKMSVRDARPLTGQTALFTSYDLDQPQITVLTLHGIGAAPAECESHDYRNMFITAHEFEELVDDLLSRGWNFVSLDMAANINRGAAHPVRKAVVLTFDDGYASVFEEAFPILAARGIVGAAFVPTAYIGRAFGGNTRAGCGPDVPVMSAAQLRELHAAGWEIGSHSVSHPVFTTLGDERVGHELQLSRQTLADILETPVRSFAFPYGEPGVAYRPQDTHAALEAGYERVMTMRPGFLATSGAAREWPRIGVGADATVDSLLAQIAAAHRDSSGWPGTEARGPSLRERVRGVVRRCVDAGIATIALYGAGQHTAKLLRDVPLWPLNVLAILDDNERLWGTRTYGLPVHAAADAADLGLDAVLISSDQFEDAIYERIAPLEGRGIRVLRLYGGNNDPAPPAPVLATV